MTAILPLGIIALVVGFLIGVLGYFPIGADSSSSVDAQTADGNGFSTEAVEEMGSRFLSGYTSVVEGLMSYQKDPDYERAERDREAMTAYAKAIVPEFKGLADELKDKLDALTPGRSDDN